MRGAIVGAAALWCLVAPASGVAADPLGTVTEYTHGNPGGITAGSDGNLWFTEPLIGGIGRITPTGTITDFSLSDSFSDPYGIAMGPDGNAWFAEAANDAIGRITPAGTITEFALPLHDTTPITIAMGPDGNMWFTEHHQVIGRITPTGTITEFPLPAGVGSSYGITAGPDGNLWFGLGGDGTHSDIGRITPSGTITTFPIPSTYGDPTGIAAGPDGNLWFTEAIANQIGRITPTGKITEFPLPKASSAPQGIAPGPDGNMWFTEYTGARIGRITPTGVITEYPELPSVSVSEPSFITPGPDGNEWFADTFGNKVGYVGTGVSAASAHAPNVTGSQGQGMPQACEGAQWAQWAGETPSSSAYPFDGYQWQLDGSPISGATSQTYTPIATDVGHKLSCRVTVTYPVLNVTVSATSAGVTVLPPASALAGQLVTDAGHVGPGAALEDKASAIQTAANSGQTATACAGITDLLGLVKAQTGKHLSNADASTLTTDANNLATALGC